MIPAALQEHYDSGNTSMAVGMFIERKDGQRYGFTSSSQAVTLDVGPWVGGVSTPFTLSASQGLNLRDFVRTLGMAPDNSEIETLDDDTLFTREDVLAARWWNAQYRIFRYRWDVSPPVIGVDVEVVQRGRLGGIKVGETTLSVDLRGLKQRLQQTIAVVSTKTCTARHGSVGDRKCNRDVSAETFTHTVTAVVDRFTFAASAAGDPEDYFGNGELIWLTGESAGVDAIVKTFVGGLFTLHLPAVFDIQVGDTFQVIRGGRKTREVCAARGNVINFQGQPDRPSVDQLTRGS